MYAALEDDVYSAVIELGRGLVGYYSIMAHRQHEFRYSGKSNRIKDADEYFCTACRKVDPQCKSNSPDHLGCHLVCLYVSNEAVNCRSV